MALINCADTVQLIFAFVFAHVKSRFSHDAAHDITLHIFFSYIDKI